MINTSLSTVLLQNKYFMNFFIINDKMNLSESVIMPYCNKLQDICKVASSLTLTLGSFSDF